MVFCDAGPLPISNAQVLLPVERPLCLLQSYMLTLTDRLL
jgi:hypothetical protein